MASNKEYNNRPYMVHLYETEPCFVCGIMGFHNMREERQVHHLQGAYRLGMGLRDDRVCVVLCKDHHDEIHSQGERKFWDKLGVDPKEKADQTYQQYLARKK